MRRLLKLTLVGGGSGIKAVASMLRDDRRLDITLIHSTFDDGGHSGRLRRRGYGALGDIRKGLEALADPAVLTGSELGRIFGHRCKNVDDPHLDSASGGNLLLAMSLEIRSMDWQRLPEAIGFWSRILKVRGLVMPVSMDVARLHGFGISLSSPIYGQKAVDIENGGSGVFSISLMPPATIHPPAAEAVRASDIVLFCPGSFWGSIMVHSLVDGFNEAVADAVKSGCRTAMMVNPDKPTRKNGLNSSRDFVRELADSLSLRDNFVFDAVFCNDAAPSGKAAAYMAKRGMEATPFVRSDRVAINVSGAFVDWLSVSGPRLNATMIRSFTAWIFDRRRRGK